MEVKDKLINIFQDNGIYIDKKKMGEDIDLRDYITDSIQYISFIVEIEKEFDIEFPDELLLFDKIASLNGFSNIIKAIILDRNISQVEFNQNDFFIENDDFDENNFYLDQIEGDENEP